jgi:hypothetical protein
VQQRYGADRLVVALVDVDPEYFGKQEYYLPQARKILQRHKLDWPNALANNGFTDTVRLFNLSGYGNIVVDGKGVVRGVNVHGAELERLVGEMMAQGKASKPKP